MTPKPTTINTVTLTCSACGSSAFTKLAPNEYRCNHCSATTLVEDDVAQRLEKILRNMQPAAAPRTLGKGALIALVAIVAATTLVPVLVSLLTPSRPTPTPVHREPPIDASLVRLGEVQEVGERGRRELLFMIHNETGRRIDAPRVTATFRQGEVALGSAYGSPLARTLQPGEYTPVTISVPSEAHSGYTLQVNTPTASRSHQLDVKASKVQLVRNDNSLRLIGLLTNQSTTETTGSQITTVLYGEDGRIIGTGTGYAKANRLAPQATTTFEVHLKLYREGRIAAYEYMVQSEK
ncbi:hypothetical protein CEG14_10450 [Bordetella genomosp. 1]|uniref:Uncharacterized protein n=1 Tax=Bordetella genomosp. 1 TaxID=1395607 RepID=A0A261SIT8_9BORD|nr:FxLYD domain-containing protein [Bordetella genomosp. 1]MDQ8032019.1 FxLYD domain-containing protein [Bordetella sp.]OZI36680.1 hypothetical protein CEG14_10450 [Bordetella genomosp. 1]OZI64266.1 hypothetical protein CAL27_15760 [Bordetella genomosp. 1]